MISSIPPRRAIFNIIIMSQNVIFHFFQICNLFLKSLQQVYFLVQLHPLGLRLSIIIFLIDYYG